MVRQISWSSSGRCGKLVLACSNKGNMQYEGVVTKRMDNIKEKDNPTYVISYSVIFL
jgi:hypothetical protein